VSYERIESSDIQGEERKKAMQRKKQVKENEENKSKKMKEK
jgi:hypothetical protein